MNNEREYKLFYLEYDQQMQNNAKGEIRERANYPATPSYFIAVVWGDTGKTLVARKKNLIQYEQYKEIKKIEENIFDSAPTKRFYPNAKDLQTSIFRNKEFSKIFKTDQILKK